MVFWLLSYVIAESFAINSKSIIHITIFKYKRACWENLSYIFHLEKLEGIYHTPRPLALVFRKRYAIIFLVSRRGRRIAIEHSPFFYSLLFVSWNKSTNNKQSIIKYSITILSTRNQRQTVSLGIPPLN